MPIKGDVKKDFIRLHEQVKNSVMDSAKFMVEQVLAAAKRDGLIIDEGMERAWSKKKNKPYKRYREVPAANVLNHYGRRLFHYSKFIERTGSLRLALTPVGAGWQGNKLATLGQCRAEVEKTTSGAKGSIIFGRNIGIALRGGKRTNYSDEKVEIVDENGDIIASRTIRRRIIENAARTIVGLWNNRVKKDFDKIARAFK